MTDEYNPYDLVPIRVNGIETVARPIEFNADIYDEITMTDKHGHLIVPSKISIMCPVCGAGWVFDVDFVAPPFRIYDLACTECQEHAEIPVFNDPFVNPVEANIISADEFKLAVQKVTKNDGLTVQQRLEKKQKAKKPKVEKPKKPPIPEVVQEAVPIEDVTWNSAVQPVIDEPVVDAVVADEPIIAKEDQELMDLLAELDGN